MSRVLSLLIVVGLWAVPSGSHDHASPITVAAAVSLTDALTAAAGEYGEAGQIHFNFAASNVLARQIVSGAPVDLFISADESQMDVVARAGLIADGTRIDLLTNQLAVIVPDDRPRTLSGIRDLLDPSITRLALGDPAAVPAGVYAKQYLEKEGIWAIWSPGSFPLGVSGRRWPRSKRARPMRRSSTAPTRSWPSARRSHGWSRWTAVPASSILLP